MMPYVWQFKQYRSPVSGRGAIDDWRKALSPARRAIFDSALSRIAKMQDWPPGYKRSLVGHPDCWEIRWVAEKVEHRAFGYFGDGKEFRMMVGCTHKGKVYDPPGAFDMLDTRKRDSEKDEGLLDVYRRHER